MKDAGCIMHLFEASTPVALFQTQVPRMILTESRNYYAVGLDGQRFLIKKVVVGQTSEPITVVVNWPAELKR